MKNIVYIFSIIFIGFLYPFQNLSAQDIPIEENQKESILSDKQDTSVVRFVEKMPEFPGGNNEFYKYLQKELKYPEECRKRGITGKVIVEFVIEKDGSISNVRTIVPVYPALDAEAERVIRNSPKWKPGSQLGKPVRVFYQIPIKFSLG